MTLGIKNRNRILPLLLAVLFVAGLAPDADARVPRSKKKKTALTAFERAQQLREALNGRTAENRTRREYTRVINAYRSVYYTAPTSPKADEAVVAVAELLADTGRTFNDRKSTEAAIGQYRFLEREYPGSRYRFEGLFTVAQIYHDDLHENDKAKEAFQEFLKRYPGHRLAKEAKAAIAEIEAEARAPRRKEKEQEKPEVKTARTVRSKLPLVTNVRTWSTPDYTRIAIDLEEQVKYEAGRVPNPDRIYFDLHDTKLASELVGKTFEVGNGFLRKVRVAQFTDRLSRVVLEVNEVAEYSAFLLPNPYRLIIDIHGRQEVAKAKPGAQPAPAEPKSQKQAEPALRASDSIDVIAPADDTADPDNVEIAKAKSPELKATEQPTSGPTFETVAPRKPAPPTAGTSAAAKPPAKPGKRGKAPSIREARPTENGERSLIRALGLKIGKIVVDAGHGGHDTGTIGANGLQEKDVVLDVALRLGKLLSDKLGAEVVYTRDDDTFIPLETRTAIANKERADLFISIHANSSRDPSARGIETYYLNFTSSPEALEVAARENAVSEKSIFELQDLVKKIAMKEKIEESREFASNVQKSLHSGLAAKNPGLRDRGVKKAPFIVLIGANMPSILAEISFVSNPRDEQRLSAPDYRQRIADSIYKGVANYVGGLSGVKLANRPAAPTSGGE